MHVNSIPCLNATKSLETLVGLHIFEESAKSIRTGKFDCLSFIVDLVKALFLFDPTTCICFTLYICPDTKRDLFKATLRMLITTTT